MNFKNETRWRKSAERGMTMKLIYGTWNTVVKSLFLKIFYIDALVGLRDKKEDWIKIVFMCLSISLGKTGVYFFHLITTLVFFFLMWLFSIVKPQNNTEKKRREKRKNTQIHSFLTWVTMFSIVKLINMTFCAFSRSCCYPVMTRSMCASTCGEFTLHWKTVFHSWKLINLVLTNKTW